jgi:hypothetical protein
MSELLRRKCVYTVKNYCLQSGIPSATAEEAKDQTISLTGKLTFFRQSGCLFLRQLVDFFNSVTLQSYMTYWL